MSNKLDSNEIREVAEICMNKESGCEDCKLISESSCDSKKLEWLISMADEIERLREESVWNKAPIVSNKAVVKYYDTYLTPDPNFHGEETFNRSVPKTRDRVIAEKYAEMAGGNTRMADLFEEAIIKAKKDGE